MRYKSEWKVDCVWMTLFCFLTSSFPIQKVGQSDIDKICSWFTENNLVLNSDKTKYIIHTHQFQSLWNDFFLTFNKRWALNRVCEIKYPGILFGSNLTCKKLYPRNLEN